MEILIEQKIVEQLYSFFSQKLKDYMPQDSFRKIWNDSIIGLGKFIELGETTRDISLDYIFYQILIFEKLKIRLKFVYDNETITGLWINYIGVQ